MGLVVGWGVGGGGVRERKRGTENKYHSIQTAHLVPKLGGQNGVGGRGVGWNLTTATGALP